MVTIHKKSIKVTKEFLETPLYGELTKNALRNDCVALLQNLDIDVAEFPAPDGSVELVAEVVTMTKQDYDELITFLKGVYHGHDIVESMLVSEIYKMLTGKSIWA